MKSLDELINESMPQYLSDLSKLISIPSVQNLSSKQINSPFGKEIRDCMDIFLEISTGLGYKVKDVDGYVVFAQLGDSEEHLGILGHLDVVAPANINDWTSNPFLMRREGDNLYGRGVNDDKGPLLAALYAGKIAKDINPNIDKSIRVIAGGAEETSWECINYYFNKYDQPIFAFSPDGDSPVVNGEKGILQVELEFLEDSNAQLKSYPPINYVCEKFFVDKDTYIGSNLLSRNPHRGQNAIDIYFDSEESKYSLENLFSFIKNHLHNDYFGNGLKLNKKHFEMGDLTVCMMSMETRNKKPVLTLDFRYPINISEEKILTCLNFYGSAYSFKVNILKKFAPLYIPSDDILIQRLLDSYEKVMGDRPKPITKGGASYARALDHGVSFGATFLGENPRPHMSNETMKISSIKKVIEIYVNAIINLTR